MEEKQAYLFEIDPKQALTPDELTRVTTDLQLLDNTKDTAIIRDNFLTLCKDGVIKENLISIGDSSDEVDVCLLILYNYLTIEKYRDMLLVRFLSLRNMEAETSYVTEAYWAVQQSRLSVVQQFVKDIEENTLDGPYGATNQGWTGSKNANFDA